MNLLYLSGIVAVTYALLQVIGGSVIGGTTPIGGGAQSCGAWVNYAGPFPDSNCTGVPSGTSLTSYGGPFSFTSGTATIDSKNITQCLSITGSASVTITKSSISSSTASCGEGEVVYVSSGGSLSISDSTVDCGGDPPGGYNNSHGIGDSNITARRIDIIGCENGGTLGGHDNDIQDSYIHDMRQCSAAEGCGAPDGSHTDGFQFFPGAIRTNMVHNTILSMKAGAHTPETVDTYYTTSAIITFPTDADGTFDKNLFAGGAYTVYCPEMGTNWTLNNNTFDRRYKSTVGFFGPTDACSGLGTGNKYEDGSTLILTWWQPFQVPLPILAWMNIIQTRLR